MTMTLQLAPVTFDLWGGGTYGTVDIAGQKAFVTSPFGMRELTPELIALGIKDNFHPAIDIAFSDWTPLPCLETGLVEENPETDQEQDGRGFWLSVISGDYKWRAAHLSEPARDYSTGRVLQPGDVVTRGMDLMRTGHSGRADGAHLHLETWYLPNLEPRNPTQYMKPFAVAAALSYPQLTREELGAALLEKPSILMLREASDLIEGGETYRLVVQRREADGSVV